jgi:hypothetical protein
MFGCGGDDAATDDGRDYVHGDEGNDFDDAVNDLGLMFNDPATAGRPSPSFNADILPILTNRCAIPGCHVAGGPRDIDLRTYDSVIKGGDEGALPILTNRCAIPGCHVAGGPRDIDLRTYGSVIKGGDEGAIVIAADAMESEMVEEIAEGKMPPEGPPLEAAQIQLIIDWINEGAENN